MDDAWTMGYEAAAAGYPQTINPFQLDTEEYQEWNEGYDRRGVDAD